MKAVVQDSYGRAADVLKLEDIAKPALDDGRVLIRVRAAGVNALDWHYVTGSPYVMRLSEGRSRPKVRVRGVDVAGQVEAVGAGVTTLNRGDDVFGWCDGAFAEYSAAAADHFVKKPANMTYEEAAAVPVAAVTALQGLRDHGNLKAGQKVLINGAAGGVGIFAVQIAKASGAEATGVCSARNVAMVTSLGADHVIDYQREDFTRRGERYDLILDNAGSQSLGALQRTLAPGGVIVYNSGASMLRMAGAILRSRTGRTFRNFLAKLNQADLALIADLISRGKVRSVIDRTYPLDQAAAAVAYVQEGHARGKVVLTTSA